MFYGVCFQYSQLFVSFLFSESYDLFWWVGAGSSISSVIRCFLLFIISMAHITMPNSIPISYCISSLPVLGFPNLFTFFVNSLMSSINIWWSIFSCDSWSTWTSLLKIVIVVGHRPGRYFSGFLPQQSFSPWCLFDSPVFHYIFHELHDFTRYLVNFMTVYYEAMWEHIIWIFWMNPLYNEIFPSRFTIFEDVFINS